MSKDNRKHTNKTTRTILNMTDQELLAEAKRRYPIGTRFKCVDNTVPYDSNRSGLLVDKFYHDNMRIDEYKSYPQMIDADGKFFIHSNGKWAEIVVLGTGIVENIYSIY